MSQAQGNGMVQWLAGIIRSYILPDYRNMTAEQIQDSLCARHGAKYSLADIEAAKRLVASSERHTP